MSKTRHTARDEQQFLQLIRARETTNPNIPIIESSLIRKGRTYKVASLLHIKSQKTGDITHHNLRLQAFDFTVGSVSISTTQPQRGTARMTKSNVSGRL